jgi:hypothetical protein
MAAEAFLRRTHRVIAALFLLTIPPAAYFSIDGADPAHPSPFVYLPLFPLFLLTLTGTYLLVRPWILRIRARRAEPA